MLQNYNIHSNLVVRASQGHRGDLVNRELLVDLFHPDVQLLKDQWGQVDLWIPLVLVCQVFLRPSLLALLSLLLDPVVQVLLLGLVNLEYPQILSLREVRDCHVHLELRYCLGLLDVQFYQYLWVLVVLGDLPSSLQAVLSKVDIRFHEFRFHRYYVPEGQAFPAFLVVL